MKRSIVRGVLALALVATMGVAPSFAYADDDKTTYAYGFNDGNGNCGTIECGPYGCAVIEQHPCPNEVSPNG